MCRSACADAQSGLRICCSNIIELGFLASMPNQEALECVSICGSFIKDIAPIAGKVFTPHTCVSLIYEFMLGNIPSNVVVHVRVLNFM